MSDQARGLPPRGMCAGAHFSGDRSPENERKGEQYYAACWSRKRGEVGMNSTISLVIAVLVIILLIVLILQFV
jgi:hypothetical protein